MTDLEQRGIHVRTESGLTLVGDSCADSRNAIALAHNASMTVLEQKLSALEAKLAAVVAAVAVLEGAK